MGGGGSFLKRLFKIKEASNESDEADPGAYKAGKEIGILLEETDESRKGTKEALITENRGELFHWLGKEAPQHRTNYQMWIRNGM
jgi:hypothetical protein